jgi:murein L,D-transpeptidase YcbB/YkuD
MITVFAARFHELGYLDYPRPLTYDEHLSRAVHQFQENHRLVADGVLDARTAMVLDRLTDRDQVPQLIKGDAQ